MLKNVYYINLEHRTDRKDKVEAELSGLGWEYQRFNAVKHKSGRVGCSTSHLRLLEMAKEKDLEYIVIVEDDIHFTHPELYKALLNQFFSYNLEFDVDFFHSTKQTTKVALMLGSMQNFNVVFKVHIGQIPIRVNGNRLKILKINGQLKGVGGINPGPG